MQITRMPKSIEDFQAVGQFKSSRATIPVSVPDVSGYAPEPAEVAA